MDGDEVDEILALMPDHHTVAILAVNPNFTTTVVKSITLDHQIDNIFSDLQTDESGCGSIVCATSDVKAVSRLSGGKQFECKIIPTLCLPNYYDCGGTPPPPPPRWTYADCDERYKRHALKNGCDMPQSPGFRGCAEKAICDALDGMKKCCYAWSNGSASTPEYFACQAAQIAIMEAETFGCARHFFGF